MKEVPYRYLTPLRDHNEPEAIAYMIADNKTTDDSYWNHSKLDTLFEDLKLTGFDVELTGFDTNDEPINIENPDFDIEKEWEGMPELKEEITNIRLVVHFRNEDDKTEFGELISQKLDETTKSIWHPPLEHQKSMDHIYTDIE